MSYHEEDTQKAGVGMIQDLNSAIDGARRRMGYAPIAMSEVVMMIAPVVVGTLALVANSLSQIADELRATRRGDD